MAEAAAALNVDPAWIERELRARYNGNENLTRSRYHLGRFQEELRGQEEAEKAAFVRMAEEFKIP